MDAITILLSEIVKFSFASAGNFGLVVSLIGCIGLLTQKPRKDPKPTPRNGTKRKAKGRTKAKPRTAPKAKKQAAKPWYVAPPMTPHQQVIHDKYRAKYWGEKVDDSWGGYGIPL